MIEQRRLGTNGPLVSAIALGSRSTSTNKATKDDEKKQTIYTIQSAIDAGINFLNTADFYGMGENELLIGNAIKGKREKVFLSVKCGMRRSPTGAFLGMDCSPSSIKNFCSYSLTRLGVDEIDLYQPARLDSKIPLEETVGAIADLIKEGKVKHLGLSEIGEDQLRRAHAVYPVSALEIEYSLASRFIERNILPTARELGISIVPYSVLYYGLLTGTFSGIFDKNDYRTNLPRFQPENLPFNLDKVEVLKDMAKSKGVSASQLAIAWLLQQGKDIIPIVGMSKPDRIADNLQALIIEFTSQEKAKLNDTFALDAMKGDRYPEALMSLVPS